MKIQVTTTQTKEVEISLPVYKKSVCHFYKVYSEKESLQVCTLNGHLQIQIVHTPMAFSEGNEDCTEKEFLNGFNKIYNKLLKLTK